MWPTCYCKLSMSDIIFITYSGTWDLGMSDIIFSTYMVYVHVPTLFLGS